MNQIKQQFRTYLLSLLYFCIGAISTKSIFGAGICMFVPLGLNILFDWDDAKYKERHPENGDAIDD